MTDLSNHTALITGGARRLGRALSVALAAEGANVVLHYHASQHDAENLAEELRGRGVRVWTLAADLADPAQAESLVARAGALAGRLDLLVNNASDFPPSTMASVTWEDLQRQTALTAWAPFAICRRVATQTPTGSIVNVLDARLSNADPGHVAYLWAKQLLAQMTRHLALTYAPGITVNGVAPGLILPPPGRDHSYLDALANTVPLQRHGDPEDIAAATVFLLKSRFITGEVVFVDGGAHLRGPSPSPLTTGP
jgi:pteridine reductase